MQKWRFFIQVTFVVFVLYLSLGRFFAEAGINIPLPANLHLICPFGGVVTAYTFVTTGNYIQKIHQSDFVMIFALLIALILTGATFCGWICPMGSVQEWLGKLGKKLFPKIYNKLPRKLDRMLRFGKVVVFVLVIIQTTRSGKLLFQAFDPYYNLFNIWTDEIALTGYISVAITLFLSLLIERPFCRYACPLGAINGLFNSFSILNIKRKNNTCIQCKICDKVCPAGIVVSEKVAVRSIDCIRCMKCVQACPVNKSEEKTLKIRLEGTKFEKTRAFSMPFTFYLPIVLAAFLVPIFITVLGGSFVTEISKTYETASDIRGSSTLAEIIENFEVSKDLLFNAFGIPIAIPEATLLKDLSLLMGLKEEDEIVSPEKLRLFVSIMNLPATDLKLHAIISEEKLNELLGTYVLEEGLTIKQLAFKSKSGTIAYLLSGKWPSSEELKIVTTVPEVETHEATAVQVDLKGSTALGDAIKMIKNPTDFFASFPKLTNEPDSSTLKSIKDKYGIEVSEIRDFVQANLK